MLARLAAEFEHDTDTALETLDEAHDRQIAATDEDDDGYYFDGKPRAVVKVALIRYQSWREARRAALLALQRRRAVVVLLGPPGVGKSAMLDRLEEFLVSRRKHVVIQRGEIDLDAVPADATLFIDDADDLPIEALEQLSRRPDLGFVLTGDERLAPVVRKLTKREMPLAGRARIISLEPVVGNDLAAYVEARLPRRRQWRWEFGPEVVSRIAELSGGVPAELNELIDGVAAWAVAERQKLITVDLVDNAATGAPRRVADEPPVKRARQGIEGRRKRVKPAPRRRSFIGWLQSLRG